jgi:hypothetical protein
MCKTYTEYLSATIRVFRVCLHNRQNIWDTYHIKSKEFHTFTKSTIKGVNTSLGMVAHTYNPSYSRDRDQEDQISKPSWGKRAYLKKPITKKDLVSGSRCRP